MSIEFYKILHLLGLFTLFTSLGGLLVYHRVAPANFPRKFLVMGHGIALVLLLVSGFGMLAKLEAGFPLWAILKTVIWLAMGAITVLIKKCPNKVAFHYFLAIVLGGAAAYLAIWKI